ncbi:MAG: hypothetical protein ABIS23_05265 [Sphingomicrobium sp.]
MGDTMDQCLTNRFHVVDDFLPEEVAFALRSDIDAHFADPGVHNADHQLWNYWYVPESYTYLRTNPEKVISQDKMDAFVQALSRWAAVNLGFASVTWPFLSLYVPGCSQVLHNDSTNGRMGFVYSLTRNDRKTIGGETIVMQDKDLFRAYLDQAAAGSALFDRIEPRFNRLVLFDDRVPHAVQRVEGSMDPVEGRFVLHGHISEAGVIAQGGLHADQVKAVTDAAMRDLRQRASPSVKGPLVVRLTISAHGSVDGIRPILDRLASSENEETGLLRDAVMDTLSAARFPTTTAATTANVPLIF